MDVDPSFSEYTELQEQECRKLLQLLDEMGIATADRSYAPGDAAGIWQPGAQLGCPPQAVAAAVTRDGLRIAAVTTDTDRYAELVPVRPG